MDIWLQHLLEVHNNRQKGTVKAAETQKKRRAELLHVTNALSSWFCGVCKGENKDKTDVEENRIACDKCDSLFHWECADIVDEPLEYLYFKCASSV